MTSRVDYTLLYFPNSGNFTGIHFQLWPGMNNTWNAAYSEDTPSFDGSFNGSSYVDSPAKGAQLTFRLALWSDFAPTRQHTGDHTRTGVFACSALVGDNTCTYVHT